MALTNPIIFGLEVTRNLADVKDNNIALQSLTLDIKDLDVIRGSFSEGASESDWLSFSGLSVPIYKQIRRFYQDSSISENYLQKRAGHNIILFGNLNINGAFDGNAIRYRYIKGLGTGTRSVALADISTSRISSWSSSANPVTASSPISYGAQVRVSTGGKLQFGTQSGVTGNRLQTTLVPEAKEFDSEFPTHKIQTNIGGQTVNLYAMKGIPVVWTGFFRNLNADIYLSSLTQNTKASWRIEQTDDSSRRSTIENFGGTHTYVRYRSVVSKERFIKFYYNPDKITQIYLNSAGITELPIVKFNNATILSFAYNELTTFPDFTDIAPNLIQLTLHKNPFIYSEISTERKLNSAVMNKIPTTVTTFAMGSCFYKLTDSDVIANRLPNLNYLNLQNSWGRRLMNETNDELPNVPSSITDYRMYNNNFKTFDTSPSGSNINIMNATALTRLELHYNNSLTSPVTFAISSNVINFVNIGVTSLVLPDMSGKTSLGTFYAYSSGSFGSLFSGTNYKFNNCSNLGTLYMYNSWGTTGPFPRFTNPKLNYIDLRYCSMSGGGMNTDGSTDTSYVLPELTFQNTGDLQNFYWFSRGSSSIIANIHPNVFTYTPKLYHVYWITWYRTPGPLPNLNGCPALTYCRFPYNNFSGNMPDFNGNPNIYYVEFQYNSLTNDIPALKNLSNLQYLRCYNNNFTGLKAFENLVNLRYFWCHNNQITGEIPTFAGCPRMYYLVMYNNQFTSYKKGAFTGITQIRYLTLQNNSLPQSSINNILEDLYDNYQSSKRGGVTIDLRGNAAPINGAANEYIQILETKGWDIRHA